MLLRAILFRPLRQYLRRRKGMLKKSPRSVTPRAVGVLVLVMAAIAAALVATVGGQTSTSAAPQRLGAAGTASSARAASSAVDKAVGSGPIVNQAVHHDLSAPLRTLKPIVIPSSGPQYTPDKGEGHQFQTGPGGNDPVVQSKVGSTQVPSTIANFEGVAVGTGNQFYAPPDENGAVGPNHYFEIVNAGIGIFTKTGTLVYGPAA